MAPCREPGSLLSHIRSRFSHSLPCDLGRWRGLRLSVIAGELGPVSTWIQSGDITVGVTWW